MRAVYSIPIAFLRIYYRLKQASESNLHLLMITCRIRPPNFIQQTLCLLSDI